MYVMDNETHASVNYGIERQYNTVCHGERVIVGASLL